MQSKFDIRQERTPSNPRACFKCRKQKERCVGGTPCERCIRTKDVCRPANTLFNRVIAWLKEAYEYGPMDAHRLPSSDIMIRYRAQHLLGQTLAPSTMHLAVIHAFPFSERTSDGRYFRNLKPVGSEKEWWQRTVDLIATFPTIPPDVPVPVRDDHMSLAFFMSELLYSK